MDRGLQAVYLGLAGVGEMSESISPIEFGRMLGLLEGMTRELRELKEQTIVRMANVEARLTTVEQSIDRRQPYMTLLEKGTWALIVLGLAAFGFTRWTGIN